MPVIDDVSKEFDLQRKRAATQEAGQAQVAQDALKRRAAQLGGGPSGALLKQENLARDASANRLANVNEGIDTAQRGEIRRLGEVKEARDFTRAEREASQLFSRGEREAGQGFSAEQAALQRRFMTGEREAGQTFASREAEVGRGFAARESALGRNFTAQENRLQRSLQSSQFAKQMDLALEQFKHQQFVDDFNMDMAEKMFNEKDALERLFEGMTNPFGGPDSLGGKGFKIGMGAGVGGVAGGLIGAGASKLGF